MVVTQDPTFQVAAFIMDQGIARGADVRNHLVAVDDIELRSGLELFPAFTTPQHTMLEATALTPAEWDAMVAAETMTGANDVTVHALPHDLLRETLRKYNRLRA